MVWLNGDRYELYGVVSYGHENCNVAGYPGIYGDVTQVKDWIIRKTGGACFER